MSDEKIVQNNFVGENLDFHALMGILRIWSVDSSSEEYHYELMTEWRGQRVHVWVRDNGNGTYDFKGHTGEKPERVMYTTHKNILLRNISRLRFEDS